MVIYMFSEAVELLRPNKNHELNSSSAGTLGYYQIERASALHL